MNRPVTTRHILVVCFSLVAATALACKVPVFRYALERWPVDRYRFVAIIDDQQSESAAKAIRHLESLSTSNVNIETEVIDLSTLSEEQLWQLEDYDGSASTPLLQVYYPQKEGKRIKCWEGVLAADSLSGWLDSPLRTQIASDLVSGESAIFLLVDGTDKAQNDDIAERLQDSLAAATRQIKIPEGVIPRSSANQYLQEHPEATMDDVLRSDVPLKVSFRLRRLSRDDPRESALLSMVHGLVEERDEPVLVPIFGRGRMLDAIKAVDCDDDVILNACRFMVGECSCTVKALNPGVDLILTVNWSDKLGQSVVMVDPKPSGDPKLVTIPSGDASSGPAGTVAETSRYWPGVVPVAVVAIVFSVLLGLGKSMKAKR
jgi:hypothetical protein